MNSQAIIPPRDPAVVNKVSKDEYEDLYRRYKHHKRAHNHYKKLHKSARKFKVTAYAMVFGYISITTIYLVTAWVTDHLKL